jgi:energy-converting hydrogenase Eha subunit A
MSLSLPSLPSRPRATHPNTTTSCSVRNDFEGSSAEKCGFVLHVAIILVGVWYGIGLLVVPLLPLPVLDEEQGFDDSWPTSIVRDTAALALAASHPFWNRYLPTALFGLFVTAPVLYAVVNSRVVVPPNAVESIHDDPKRVPTSASYGPQADATLLDFIRYVHAIAGIQPDISVEFR